MYSTIIGVMDPSPLCLLWEESGREEKQQLRPVSAPPMLSLIFSAVHDCCVTDCRVGVLISGFVADFEAI